MTYINTDDQIGAIREALDEAEACDVRVAAARAALAMLERLRAEAKARSAVYERRDAWLTASGGEAAYMRGKVVLRWSEEWETHEGAYFGRTPKSVEAETLEKALDAIGAP